MLKMHFLKTNSFYQRFMTSLICLPIFVYCFVYMSIIFCALLILVLIFIFMYEWPVLCPYSSPYFFLKTALYPTMPFAILIFLYLFFRSDLALIWGYVCCFDTSCYLIGNLFGATPITDISPKKTWEGLIGGIIVSEFLFFLLYRFVRMQSWGYQFFVFYFLVSIVAVAGDLFESWLKRNAGVKNSGTILPGHGGLLDRVDSILFVATGYALYRILQFVIIR